MNSKKVSLSKHPGDLLKTLGVSIRNKRKMRMITIARLARELDLSRTTLHLIEKGSPSVSMGAYIQVMCTLGFSNRLIQLAEN